MKIYFDEKVAIFLATTKLVFCCCCLFIFIAKYRTFLKSQRIIHPVDICRMPHCTECGALKTKLNRYKLCTDCSKKDNSVEMNTAADPNIDMESVIQEQQNPGFWNNMNKLLDTKFTNFEQTLKTNILTEVKQITDPISKEVKDLKEENKKLKSEVTLLKAKEKEQSTRLDKIENVVKEQQKTLIRNDKEARGKRLMLAGVPEGKTKINGVESENDREKVEEVMNILNSNDIKINNLRRIGKKDQGTGDRSRYLQLEFGSINDRNSVKKKSENLKNNEDTKNFFMKADLTKKEREEFKRLYSEKKRIEEDDPNKSVKIEHGKLYVDGTVVDYVQTANNYFL